MINNRQAGRRNRGRNNGRQNGGNRSGESGNRIDNRSRGNAPQLLEKYRNLARDAQLAGDRVNAEYYLQFADHYFRVIADNRARQEEYQSRFRRNDESFDDYTDQDEASPVETSGIEGDEPQGRRNREPRQRERYERQERPVAAEAEAPVFAEAAEPVVAEEDAAPKRRGRKPRQPREEQADREDALPGLDLAALPPAIARADNDSGVEEAGDAPAPRRRGRRPRATAEAAE